MPIKECYYYNHALRPKEIIPPSSYIVPPLVSIILPLGRLRRDNVSYWQD